MKKILFLFFLSIMVNITLAQVFPRYYVKRIIGEAFIEKPGKKNEKLKVGTFLFVDDVLSVASKSAVITLLSHENFYVVVDTPGVYKSETLSQYKSAEKTGISKKYFKLVWHELFQPDTDKHRLSPANLAGSWGAAEKGDCSIGIYPANNEHLYGDTVFFKWKSENGKYIFKLYDHLRRELTTIITSDTMVGLLKRQILKEGETNIYWKIINESGSCSSSREYNFKLLATKEEANQEIEKLLNSIESGNDVFLDNLKKADVLGQHGWFKEAVDYLGKALAIAQEQKL